MLVSDIQLVYDVQTFAANHRLTTEVSVLVSDIQRAHAVQTFAANHRLTSDDNELFPSRESSFVRSSGNSFVGRSGSSFVGRLPSRTAGPPNLQRVSASAGGSLMSVCHTVKASLAGMLVQHSCVLSSHSDV